MMADRYVYLDNNATTAMAPEVKEIMRENEDLYGNASSMHAMGRMAESAILWARGKVAALLGAASDEVFFTSGATEGNNTVFNIFRDRADEGCSRNRIVLSSVEHPASIETAKYLKKKGYVDAVCDQVLEKLRGYGFVDDAEYCAQYIRSAGKDKGARLIALELKKRGVDERTAEEALAGLEGEEDAAAKVLAKYMKNREFTRENLAKAYRHLMSKGFDYDTAKAALESLRGGPEEEE